MSQNWDDVRFFLALCRKNSFVAAANELKVNHTTVSRRISALEDSLQTRLFERTEKGCRLTPAARILLPYAEKMENLARTLEDNVAGEDRQLSGTIRIGAPDGFGNYFLAPRIGSLLEEHPELEVELQAVPFYFSLAKREIDLSITVEQPTSGNIVARRLTKYRLGLYAAKSYLVGKPKIRNFEDLKKHRIIGYIDDLLFDQDLKFMNEFFPGLHPNFRSTTVIAQKNAVFSGVGIGIVPYFMVDKREDLVPVLPETYIERTYWLQVNPDSREIARIRATMSFIIEQVEANETLFMTQPVN